MAAIAGKVVGPLPLPGAFDWRLATNDITDPAKWIGTRQLIANEALRILADNMRIPNRIAESSPTQRLGNTVLPRSLAHSLPITLDRQLCADYRAPDESLRGMSYQDYSTAFIRPAMTAMAGALNNQAAAQDANLIVSAALPLPPHWGECATVAKDGLSLRLVEYYELERDALVMRFDVLAGFGSI